MKSGVHLLIRQEAAQELADRIIADGGEGDGAQAQSARPDRDIDRAAAYTRFEAGDIVELGADIESEEIQRDPPDRDQVDRHVDARRNSASSSPASIPRRQALTLRANPGTAVKSSSHSVVLLKTL